MLLVLLLLFVFLLFVFVGVFFVVKCLYIGVGLGCLIGNRFYSLDLVPDKLYEKSK